VLLDTKEKSSAADLSEDAVRTPYDDRVINVYSDDDYVLSGIYPFVHGCGDCAGAKPVEEKGVKNVRVGSGHLSYSQFAHLLFDYAVGKK